MKFRNDKQIKCAIAFNAINYLFDAYKDTIHFVYMQTYLIFDEVIDLSNIHEENDF